MYTIVAHSSSSFILEFVLKIDPLYSLLSCSTYLNELLDRCSIEMEKGT